MEIKKLTLTNVRTFSHAEFDFQPGMNLIVGINGAGKSTVLDVLRIMLAQTLPEFTAARNRSKKEQEITFGESDIAIGQGALTTQMEFTTEQQTFKHLIHMPRAEYAIDAENQGNVRDQTYDLARRDELTPNDPTILQGLRARIAQPFALFFSAHRSVLDTNRSSRSGQAAAFADALISDRGLNVREFAEWWLVQEALLAEERNDLFKRRLTVLAQTACIFLDDCTNLRAQREPSLSLVIDKGGKAIDVRFMSDGERSMIALVLEIARRLLQANPQLDDPIADGKAVILIDELDLHLHPSWQRTIVDRLTNTFPNCQFICTTHSPQIIGEVLPEQIILIMDGKAERPNQSLGMDTNWILRHLMDVPVRDTDTLKALRTIEKLIEAEKYDTAEAQIDQMRNELGDFPELVGLQTQIDMIDFWADEIENQGEDVE